jgi:hypothetical protein
VIALAMLLALPKKSHMFRLPATLALCLLDLWSRHYTRVFVLTADTRLFCHFGKVRFWIEMHDLPCRTVLCRQTSRHCAPLSLIEQVVSGGYASDLYCISDAVRISSGPPLAVIDVFRRFAQVFRGNAGLVPVIKPHSSQFIIPQ